MQTKLKSTISKLTAISAIIFSHLYVMNAHASPAIAAGYTIDNHSYLYSPLILLGSEDYQTWSYISNLPQPADGGIFYTAHCQNSVCIAAGTYNYHQNGIYSPLLERSIDHGKTWSLVNIPRPNTSLDGMLQNIMCNDSICLASGLLGDADHTIALPILYFSQDGGLNWQPIDMTSALPAGTTYLVDVSGISQSNALFVTAGDYVTSQNKNMPIILTSKDGQHWQYTTTIANLPLNFDYAVTTSSCNNSFCLAGGWRYDYPASFSLILASYDAGNHWVFVGNPKSPNTDDGFYSAASCSEKICVMVGYNSTEIEKNRLPLIITTNNEGKSWSYATNINHLPTKTAMNYAMLNAVSCSHSLCTAVGSYDDYAHIGEGHLMILSSHNAGKSWTFAKDIMGLPIKHMHSYYLNSVSCNEQGCIAGGGYGRDTSVDGMPMLLVSDKNGENWKMQNIQNLPKSQLGNIWGINHSENAAKAGYSSNSKSNIANRKKILASNLG